MKNNVPDSYLAAVFAAVVGAVFTWAGSDFWTDIKPTVGGPLVDLFRIIAFLGFAAFSFAILHYFGILGAGAQAPGTRERSDYDALRERITSGNWVSREYSRRLGTFLDAVDHFFGDASMADRTLFPHAFGLTKSSPLWTAPSFDRCLLLAFFYPIIAIFLIWAITNHIGPAEAALGLKSTTHIWQRAAAIATIIFSAFGIWRFAHAKSWDRLTWMAASLTSAFISIGFFGGVVAVGVAIAGIVVSLLPVIRASPSNLGANCVTTAVIFAVVAGAILGITQSVSIAQGVAVATLASILILSLALAIAILGDKFTKKGRQGVFLALSTIFTASCCLAGAVFLSTTRKWQTFGALFVFLGLIALLNTPFDWLSLGLTRALMRRGLEREKWWPYFYAAGDALFASIIIAVLAVTMVIGVQLFDDLAEYRGGEAVMPPMRDFLDAIRAHPSDPEYWWVYATLFSTMVPSLVNLFIAGASLARGIPGVSNWLLGKVREGEAVPAYDRLLVAIVLSLQGVAGLLIAFVAQAFLFWVIIWQGMPRIGIGVLDLAHLVAH